MLNQLLNGGFDLQTYLLQLLLSVPIVFLSLSLHETAHGFVAYRLGDPTARNLGRLTLNPAKHLDPIGFLCMVLFGFGWAKPVPINTRYFKKPRRDMAISAMAGPISNLLLALAFALVFALLLRFLPASLVNQSEFSQYLFQWVAIFLTLGIQLNITLAVFNLIPIPPLDGSRLLVYFLPARWSYKLVQYENYISLALMAALFFGLLDTPIRVVSNFFLNIIYRLVF